ncbi:hypothetical protein GTP55_24240 [Duganella sp. FT109W]|uniref:Uncharacterized protein n=1 Tax=Duganella margarita TaxID=2692170 RepID=A0ABW9WQY4_9BURK|nr:hypothetical protein [Duganella margarita]MYN42455.1 hypothetical protein [Duganella margarita]
MSAAKRRIKRKIKMLVRLMETCALNRNRSLRNQARSRSIQEIYEPMWRIFAAAQALGKGRVIHRVEDRSRAAIWSSKLAASVLKREQP